MNWVTIKEVNAKNKERRNTMLRSINAAPAVISAAPTTNQVINANTPVINLNDGNHTNYGTSIV